MNKIISAIITLVFALVPAQMAVATGGTIDTLEVSETAPGVISISGSVTGVKEAKITIARTDGEGEPVEVITMVDAPTNTYAAVVDTSSAANSYTVTVVDNEGGDAKTADISVSSSESISTPETNVSDEAVTATSAAPEDSDSSLPLGIIIAIVAGILIAIFIAGLFIFKFRHKKAARSRR